MQNSNVLTAAELELAAQAMQEIDTLALDAEYYAANAAANDWEEGARQYLFTSKHLDKCERDDYLSLSDDY